MQRSALLGFVGIVNSAGRDGRYWYCTWEIVQNQIVAYHIARVLLLSFLSHNLDSYVITLMILEHSHYLNLFTSISRDLKKHAEARALQTDAWCRDAT